MASLILRRLFNRVFDEFTRHRPYYFSTKSLFPGEMDLVQAGFPWHYRGEGNSSLVMTSPSTRSTLRLRKLIPPNSSSDHSQKHTEISPVAIVDYVQSVINKMFSCPKWIPKMTIVNVGHHLDELIRNLDVERDPHRRPGHHSFHSSAIIMPDLCFLPNIQVGKSNGLPAACHSFSVELKPKEGVMPTDPAAHEVRRRFSKYTLKQRLKVQEGIISAANEYDPLDLFSGDHFRMKKCLRSLISNPQNNFRLFADGVQIYGTGDAESVFANRLKWIFQSTGSDQENIVESFLDLLATALLKPSAHLNVQNSGLHPFSVLGDLMEAQKTGFVDIEPLYPQYLRILNLFSQHPGLRELLGVDGPDYRNSLFWSRENLNSIPELNSADVEALKNVRDYLSSATVKDCSLFLTFTFHPEDCSSNANLPAISVDGGPLLVFQASLIDLDPKPFERVEKHYLEAKKLIRLAEKFL